LAEEQQRRRAAEQQQQEERQQREAVEEHTRQKNLIEYLEACHNFSVALEIITNKTLTTQGDTRNP